MGRVLGMKSGRGSVPLHLYTTTRITANMLRSASSSPRCPPFANSCRMLTTPRSTIDFLANADDTATAMPYRMAIGLLLATRGAVALATSPSRLCSTPAQVHSTMRVQCGGTASSDHGMAPLGLSNCHHAHLALPGGCSSPQCSNKSCATSKWPFKHAQYSGVAC